MCGSSNAEIEMPCPPWWGNSPPGNDSLIAVLTVSKTAAVVLPGTSSVPACARISSSRSRIADTSGFEPEMCVSAVSPK